MSNNTIYVGIDYSMTSPGLCILQKDRIDLYAFYTGYKGVNNRVFDIDNGKYKLSINILKNVSKHEYKSEIQRYDMLARKMLAVLQLYPLEKVSVYMEGYSMGSRGQVFHIAENAAILKHYLFRIDLEVNEVAPTSVKKFATGSGKAQKEDMHRCFEEQTGLDLHTIMTPTRKLGSPVSDLVDAYFIAKFGEEKESQQNHKQGGKFEPPKSNTEVKSSSTTSLSLAGGKKA